MGADHAASPVGTATAEVPRGVDVRAALARPPLAGGVEATFRRLAAATPSPSAYLAGNGTVGAARGPGTTLEFDIAERAVVGFAMGAASAGATVVANLGFLNFGLHATDMLTVPPRPSWPAGPPGGGLLVVGAVGPGAAMGRQHEWCSLGYLAALSVDRVVVAADAADPARATAAWWGSGETWVVAVPVEVALAPALDGDASHRLAPAAWRADPATVNVVAAGRHAALAALAAVPAVNVVPVLDLKEPLSGVPGPVLALPSVVVDDGGAPPGLPELVAGALCRRALPAPLVVTSVDALPEAVAAARSPVPTTVKD